MPTKAFTTGRIRTAVYDSATQQLDLHFDNGTALAYKHVPGEVFRRLCSAPNPATYWEDRIAEEYPRTTASSTPAGKPGGGAGGAGNSWDDLFGGGSGTDPA